MKKVLIVSYYWPPAGGPGVQRWVKFCKYLPSFGIDPIVFIPKNASYPMIDDCLSEEISEVKTIKQKIWEPYPWAKIFSKEKTKKISSGIISTQKKSFVERFLLFIRGNFFIPDARVFWVKPSVKTISDYIEKHQIDTLITTSPPHSVNLIGIKIKEKFPHIQWIADLRDPWTNIGYHKELLLTKKSQKKHLFLEEKMLNTADIIITTSPTTKAEFQQKTSKTIVVITNGYDFEVSKEMILPSEKFLVSHIGSLLSKRNPQMLWKVLENLTQENPSFAQDFSLCLIGKTSPEVIASLKENNLFKYAQILDYLPHNEAIKWQKKSQVLLLLEINSPETQGIIPGKLFEYLSSGRPILALGYKDWDAADIIKETKSGKVAIYDDFENIKSCILELYKDYKENPFSRKHSDIQKFHRKHLTEQLSQIIFV